MKNTIKIPHAENTFVDTDAQAHKILHVVTKLSEKPGTPGFDPHAKQAQLVDDDEIVAQQLLGETAAATGSLLLLQLGMTILSSIGTAPMAAPRGKEARLR